MAMSVGTACVLAKTQKAMLVQLEVDDSECWIPFSQIDGDSELYETSEIGDTGDLVVSDWFADKVIAERSASEARAIELDANREMGDERDPDW
jgi:hypothetical protein